MWRRLSLHMLPHILIFSVTLHSAKPQRWPACLPDNHHALALGVPQPDSVLPHPGLPHPLRHPPRKPHHPQGGAWHAPTALPSGAYRKTCSKCMLPKRLLQFTPCDCSIMCLRCNAERLNGTTKGCPACFAPIVSWAF
jgi:hypothetical protein